MNYQKKKKKILYSITSTNTSSGEAVFGYRLNSSSAVNLISTYNRLETSHV